MDTTTYLYFTLFTPLVYFTFISPFLAAGSSTSAASALVTTTAGAESSNHPVVPLTRPTNLFNTGLRGAVNFSYRPQIDDELENEDEFASSMGSFIGGSLHFDHNGPYAYNTPYHGYLVYNGQRIPRDNSSFSLQTTPDATLLENQQIYLNLSNKKQCNKRILDNSNLNEELPITKDNLLETHMLKEHKIIVEDKNNEQAKFIINEHSPREEQTTDA